MIPFAARIVDRAEKALASDGARIGLSRGWRHGLEKIYVMWRIP